ncbi:MAG TPA: hypothetical protein VII86_07625, partial [Thermoanaerobaculia bacterium]
NDGTAVTLTANPAAGSTFGGWGGACTGTGSCQLTMNADKTVSAIFNNPGGTQLLRPNGDITSQWSMCCSVSSAWDALDDNVTQAQGSIPVEKFLYTYAVDKVTEVALTNYAIGTTTPSAGKAWFYMDTAPGQTVRADVIWGGSVRGTTTVPGSSGYAWRSINVVPPDQAAVDDLRIRFTSTTAGTSSSDIFAAYFELTTT